MKPWIVYARVSTDEQAERGASLDAQVAACQALLAAHGHTPVEVVRDSASAKNLKRPGIGAVIRRIQAGEIAGLCVYAIDRLSRKSRDLLELVDLFEAKKIDLVSVRERVDTSGPHGRFHLGIIGGTAQLERELIVSRVKAAMAHRKAQGGFLGRAPAGTVAIRGADNLRRLHRDPKTGDVVARIWPMLAAGRTLMDAAAFLNGNGVKTSKRTAWTRGALHYLVSARSVVGVLVDEATWKKAQAAVSARRCRARELDQAPAPNPRAEADWPLRGLVFCSRCGSAMTIRPSTGRGGRSYPYLRCSGRQRLGAGYCAAPTISYAPLEKALVDGLLKRHAAGDVQAAASRWVAERHAALAAQSGRERELRAQRDKLAQRLALVWEVVEEGGDAGRAARARLGEVQAALEAVDGQIAGLEAAASIMARDEAAMARLVEDFVDGLAEIAGASEEDRRGALLSFIGRIDLSKERAAVSLVIPGTGGALDCQEWYSQPDAGRNVASPVVSVAFEWKRVGQALVASSR